MRVNLEASVWTDARFVVLSRLMGWSDPDLAIAKVARVWRQCVIEGVYELPEVAVEALLGPGGAGALVASGLGEQLDTDATRIRIRGTRGRIEWHRNSKENGRKGGRPKAVDKKTQGVLEKKPSSSSSSSFSSSSSSSSSPAHAAQDAADAAARTQVATRSKARAHQLPADWAPTPQHLAYAQQHGLQVEHEAAGFRLHAESHQRLCVVWNAAFSQWLLKSATRPRPSPQPNRQPEPPVRRFRDI